MKAYVKPDLNYENFALAHSVAACGIKTQKKAADNGDGTYYIEEAGVTVFTDGMPCDMDSSDVEGYCYQTGSESIGLFGSI